MSNPDPHLPLIRARMAARHLRDALQLARLAAGTRYRARLALARATSPASIDHHAAAIDHAEAQLATARRFRVSAHRWAADDPRAFPHGSRPLTRAELAATIPPACIP